MLDEAKKKSNFIEWKQGDAESLPYENEEFDAITCILAVHHFTSLNIAFKETYRVLKSGNFVIFTSTREQMENYWLKEYFPKMLRESARQMPSLDNLTTSLEKSGFFIKTLENYNVKNDLVDMFLFSGKYRPEIYLDPKIRSGISSFANIANLQEVEHGLERMTKDIKTGKIQDIIRSHETALGDYLFLVANKKR